MVEKKPIESHQGAERDRVLLQQAPPDEVGSGVAARAKVVHVVVHPEPDEGVVGKRVLAFKPVT